MDVVHKRERLRFQFRERRPCSFLCLLMFIAGAPAGALGEIKKACVLRKH